MLAVLLALQLATKLVYKFVNSVNYFSGSLPKLTKNLSFKG